MSDLVRTQIVGFLMHRLIWDAVLCGVTAGAILFAYVPLYELIHITYDVKASFFKKPKS